ncbi:hypothetical protein Xekk_04523 [Xenorhabdus sp. KK7.4]|nr:hypothetical protein Xekk_04523 [Xenorhabdus sp. KK7.4]
MTTAHCKALLLSCKIGSASPVSWVTEMDPAALLILASQVVRCPNRAIGLPLANTVLAPSATTPGGWSLHITGSPFRATGLPSKNTLGDPFAMVPLLLPYCPMAAPIPAQAPPTNPPAAAAAATTTSAAPPVATTRAPTATAATAPSKTPPSAPHSPAFLFWWAMASPSLAGFSPSVAMVLIPMPLAIA